MKFRLDGALLLVLVSLSKLNRKRIISLTRKCQGRTLSLFVHCFYSVFEMIKRWEIFEAKQVLEVTCEIIADTAIGKKGFDRGLACFEAKNYLNMTEIVTYFLSVIFR